MDVQRIELAGLSEAIDAIETVGSTNSELMASRAIHINVIIRNVPSDRARLLKKVYNDIGAEAAISHEAYYEEDDGQTDIIVMGTLYQHREARRVLSDAADMKPWVAAIEQIVENAPELTA
jgi:hypothetical protein